MTGDRDGSHLRRRVPRLRVGLPRPGLDLRTRGLDYRVDLNEGADRVVRTVPARGRSYLGASAMTSGRRVRVLAARRHSEVPFERREPGKVWHLEGRGTVVVSGSGIVQFTRIVDEDGRELVVDRLRTQFT